MSVDISVSITEDVVDIIATPTVNIVNVTNSASIDPALYDLSEFTNTSLNPFVRTSGLAGYVPTSRTLTINGVTQDLSANRTYTIATGLTVGTTPIASGTIGRVLFEGTGNVLQQSANLFWDDTNGRFQVGTSSTSPFGSPLIFMGKDQNAETNFQISNSTSGTAAVVGFRVFGANNRSTFLGEFSQGHTGVSEYASHYVIEPNAAGVKHGLIISIPETTTGSDLMVYTGGRNLANRKLTLFGGTGNVGINTTTDAGFKLDVNGTARVKTDLKIETATGGLTIEGDAGGYPTLKINTLRSGATRRNWMFATEQFSAGDFVFYRSATGGGVASTLVYSIFNDGNFGLNTTTNSGFKLDVNGTARVNGNLTADNVNVNTVRASAFNNSNNTQTVFFSSAFTNTARFAGAVSMGTTSEPLASAQLDVNSTTRGFLPPRMTTTQRNAIASPAEGLQVWDTTLKLMFVYNGTTWISL